MTCIKKHVGFGREEMKLNSIDNTRLVFKNNNNAENNKSYANSRRNNVAFGSAADIMLATMDGIERGGFAASFVAQDFLGMAAPRTIKGLSRNSDATGKKNTAYATSVAIREILSGPSLFIIPSAILWGAAKFFGPANRVKFDYIKGIGDQFNDFAKGKSAESLGQTEAVKKDFYKEAFKNMLNTSLDNKVVDIDAKAQHFADSAMEIEKAKSKGFIKNLLGKPVAGSKEDLTGALMDEYVKLKKQYMPVSDNIVGMSFKTKEGTLGTSLGKFIDDLKNYTNDITGTMAKKAKNGFNGSVEEAISKFNFSRAGSRFFTTTLMTLGVFSFFTIIPKLYKSTCKTNPALQGLEGPADANKPAETEKKDGGVENENK